MILTEDEAKGRDCPMSMAGQVRSCKASDCMAWRWERQSSDEIRVFGKKGRCGMAGTAIHT